MRRVLVAVLLVQLFLVLVGLHALLPLPASAPSSSLSSLSSLSSNSVSGPPPASSPPAWPRLGPWRPVSDPRERSRLLPLWSVQEATGVSCADGRFALVGGYDPSYRLVRAKLQIFHPGHSSWTAVDLPAGVAETHHGATCAGGRIFIVSGQLGRGCSLATRRSTVFNLDTETFEPLPDLPTERYAPGVVCLKACSQLHVFGGAGPDRRSASLSHWRLDLEGSHSSWTELPELPTAGSHGFTLPGADDLSFWYGGFLHGDARANASPKHDINKDCHHAEDAHTLPTLLRYSIGGSWEKGSAKTPDMLEAVGHFANIVIEGCFIGIGGSHDGQHASSKMVQMFCAGATEWKRGLHDLPGAAKGGFAWVDQGQLRVAYFPWTRDVVVQRNVNNHLLWTCPLAIPGPLEQSRPFSAYQWMHFPFMSTNAVRASESLPVLPLVLNLDKREDRMSRMIFEMHRANVSSFVRFKAVEFASLEQAKAQHHIIQYADFVDDVREQRRVDTGWWQANVRVSNDELFRAHCGTKLSMREIFGLEALSAGRPIMLLEDDSTFLNPETWLAELEDALSYLSDKDWHLLYISYREELDWDVPELEHVDLDEHVEEPPAVRLKKVLGNTAMVVNTKRSSDLIELLETTARGGMSGAGLDWVCLKAIQEARIVVYRMRNRMVAPFKSMSSIHGTHLIYKDTVS